VRPKGSAELLSDRRKRALKFLRENWSLNEVARRIGCAASSVMRWRNAWRRRGADSLRVRFSPGRPRRLTRRQERRLVAILLQGAVAHGYRTELWTTKRVAEVIEKTFHVPCHFNTAGQLLHRLGWTHQKPERRALERDEKAIERWKRKDWPRVKKRRAAGRPRSLCR
jgi:transposase